MSPIGLDLLDLLSLHNELREGQVIRLFTRCLDDFSYANVCTRKSVETTLPSWNSEAPLECLQKMQTCDSYYATNLDEVLIIFYESLVGEENQSDRKISLDGHQYELPISMKSGQSENPPDSPTRPLTFSTFLGSTDSEDDNTTLAPNRTFSSSPVELPPPTSNTSLPCSICDHSFRSKSDEDQRSNLKQHILRSQVVRCSEPGCDKTFERSDNMVRHCRKDHAIVINPRSRGLAQRRRAAVVIS